jgi:hypothetical protein
MYWVADLGEARCRAWSKMTALSRYAGRAPWGGDGSGVDFWLLTFGLPAPQAAEQIAGNL